MILLGTSSCMDCPTTEYELYTVTHALKLCPGARRGMRGTTKARNEFKYTIARPSFLLIYTTASIHKTPPSHFGSKLRGYQQLGRTRRESCRPSAATVDNVQKLSLFRVITLSSFVYETGWRSIRQ